MIICFTPSEYEVLTLSDHVQAGAGFVPDLRISMAGDRKPHITALSSVMEHKVEDAVGKYFLLLH